MQLELEWEGATYKYDAQLLDYPTAKAIKDQLGYGLKTWQKQIDDMDPDAMNAVLFAMKRQNGEMVDRIANCQVPTVKFNSVFQEAGLKAIKAKMEEVGKVKAAKPQRRQPTDYKPRRPRKATNMTTPTSEN